MGKGAAKYGFKSGILPTTRSILKKPTTKQTLKIKEATMPKPKGIHGVGYAENIVHPKGLDRNPPKIQFINVEDMINKTVPKPKFQRPSKSIQQEIKRHKSELRRQYLSESLRNEEARLVKLDILLKKKSQLAEIEQRKHLADAKNQPPSDLTVPTLDSLMKQPFMRPRTPEEQTLLKMKRNHNREMVQFKIKERRLADLISLYHAATDFIVTEEKLLTTLDQVFATDNIDSFKRNLALTGVNRTVHDLKEENTILDSLTGTISQGRFDGLPIINEFLTQNSVTCDPPTISNIHFSK